MSEKWQSINSVGDLRKILEPYPDDRRIAFQIAFGDGQFWLVGADAGPVSGGEPPFPGISVSHPRLWSGVAGNPEEERDAMAEVGAPVCLGCGGQTRHYGDFVNHEFECQACGEYVVRLRRLGRPDGSPAPPDAEEGQ